MHKDPQVSTGDPMRWWENLIAWVIILAPFAAMAALAHYFPRESPPVNVKDEMMTADQRAELERIFGPEWFDEVRKTAEKVCADLPADTIRLDAMQARGWRIEISQYVPALGRGSWYYVGPLGIDGKPWGVGPTLREAIDDAISAWANRSEDDD